jgi:hypothetical protein
MALGKDSLPCASLQIFSAALKRRACGLGIMVLGEDSLPCASLQSLLGGCKEEVHAGRGSWLLGKTVFPVRLCKVFSAAVKRRCMRVEDHGSRERQSPLCASAKSSRRQERGGACAMSHGYRRRESPLWHLCSFLGDRKEEVHAQSLMALGEDSLPCASLQFSRRQERGGHVATRLWLLRR